MIGPTSVTGRSAAAMPAASFVTKYRDEFEEPIFAVGTNAERNPSAL